MSTWLINTAVQRAISWLPQSLRWNSVFQSVFTRSIQLGFGMLQNRAEYCTKTLDAYFALSKALPSSAFHVLEIGTGRYPVAPIAFYLCGAEQISTFDIISLLGSRRVKQTLELFASCYRSGELQKLLPRLLPERAARLEEMLLLADFIPCKRVLAKLNIKVFVRDAQQTGLPSESVNVMFSHTVLQHFPLPVLQNVFAELRRVASPGAIMGHWINMADLFAPFDPSISRLNCFRFSTRQWRVLNSPLTPQNRLRLSDYRRVAINSGFQILKEDVTSAEERELARVPLASEFRHYSREDMLAAYVFLLASSGPP